MYGGDYIDSETTAYNGVAFPFYNIQLSLSAFNDIDGITIGQNISIKAKVIEYDEVSGLMKLDSVKITSR